MPQNASKSRYYIIFSPFSGYHFTSWLQPGYRHCLFAWQSATTWLLLDLVATKISCRCLKVRRHLMLRRLSSLGCHSCELQQHLTTNGIKLALHKRPTTCVSFCQQLLFSNFLSLQPTNLLSPYQLYRSLEQQQLIRQQWLPNQQ